MAQTLLMQRLIDAFAVAAEANRRGVTTERILDEQTERISRRRFLGVAAAGLSLAACDSQDRLLTVEPRAGNSAGSNERIAIIGAGLAGLTCALRLKQMGVSATVYEANSRLGGRCWTRRGDFAAGQIAEHGGELIDQSHKHIRQLAQSLGLTLDNVLRAEASGVEPFYYFNGGRYNFAAATRDLKAIWQPLHRDLSEAGYPTLYNSFTARGQQLDQMSIASWIAQTVPGGLSSPLGQLLNVAYNIEFGAESTEQSALNLIYLLGFTGQGQLRIFGHSNEKYHVRGGNDQIVTRLAAQLSGQIVTNTALVAIERTPAGAFVLTFSGGHAAATADRVVLTVPFSVMRANVELQQRRIQHTQAEGDQRIGYGCECQAESAVHEQALGNTQMRRRHVCGHGIPGELGCFARAAWHAGHTGGLHGWKRRTRAERPEPGCPRLTVPGANRTCVARHLREVERSGDIR